MKRAEMIEKSIDCLVEIIIGLLKIGLVISILWGTFFIGRRYQADHPNFVADEGLTPYVVCEYVPANGHVHSGMTRNCHSVEKGMLMTLSLSHPKMFYRLTSE